MARDSQIDILNLSGGSHRPNCSQSSRCRLCHAAQEITDSGVCVVAGAGNRTVDEQRSLFCPARQAGVISAGACEAVCTTNMRPEGYVAGPRVRPPGAYWLDYSSKEDVNPLSAMGCYCGRGGCAPGVPCEENVIERPSEINIAYDRGRPDVLAPHHRPVTQADGTHTIHTGTSYSTPIVAGTLATITGELFNEGKRPPDPKDLKQAAIQGAVPIDEGVVDRFSALGTYRTLTG